MVDISINELFDGILSTIENSNVSDFCLLEGIPLYYADLRFQSTNTISDNKFNFENTLASVPYIRNNPTIINLTKCYLGQSPLGVLNSVVRRNANLVLSTLNTIQGYNVPVLLTSAFFNGRVLIDGYSLRNVNNDIFFDITLRVVSLTNETGSIFDNLDTNSLGSFIEDIPIDIALDQEQVNRNLLTNLPYIYQVELKDKTALRLFEIEIDRENNNLDYYKTVTLNVNGVDLAFNYTISPQGQFTLWYPERLAHLIINGDNTPFRYYLNNQIYVFQFYSLNRATLTNNNIFGIYKLGVYV